MAIQPLLEQRSTSRVKTTRNCHDRRAKWLVPRGENLPRNVASAPRRGYRHLPWAKSHTRVTQFALPLGRTAISSSFLGNLFGVQRNCNASGQKRPTAKSHRIPISTALRWNCRPLYCSVRARNHKISKSVTRFAHVN